jgi:hypothetical protein
LYTIKAGLGFDIENINEGNYNYRKARLSFNKVYSLSGVIISSGIRFSLNQLSVDGHTIITPEGDYQDGAINHNDALLNNQRFSGLGLGYDLSTFIRWGQYQSGISLSSFPNHKSRVELFEYNFSSHLNLYFSGYFLISDNIQIQPSIVLRTDFNYSQIDLSGVMNLNGSIFGGLLLRGYDSKSFDAIGMIFGHRINKRYSVYYNYDIPISSIRRSNEGSHELLLKINLETMLGKVRKPNIIFNPRFLK